MSDYLELVKAVLQVDELPPDGKWPHYDFDSDTWTHSATNPGELSDEDEQRLTARICQLVPSMSAEHWSKLDEDQRVPWLREALAAIAPAKPTQTAQAVEMLADPEKVAIVNNGRSASDRAEALCELDRSHLAWDSNAWASLLGVTSNAIRKTKFWRNYRPERIEKERRFD